ncbi:hypothetical protein L0P88_08200 [Muricauda sp. SCSIO 64092]|uniref:hypothetical protein n=1 Tax=Allomuricauda sp. SCSIO 64092 TaxID=2908842 RepID=UPI001FF2215D|nr:hypothetical protein [Muricauda sp. SCSIO 64092]UOY08523.1 hypothetical protein L0P88_08200 [Muricauda sp. SCSIO 64092]
MKKTLLIIALVCVSIRPYAQGLPKIVPPSPNAASLAQFVEIPVSHYTGLPDIRIPLYHISQGNVQVPINLAYHARGVKVAELASSYGMGWSLNAGGVITRQIRGNADDSGQGYLYQSYYDTFFTSPTTRQNAYAAEINGTFDRMPDQFFFNFLGYSGKFIYDRDTNKPILETFDDLKIETVGVLTQEIEGFIVTDTKGTKYYFGKSSSGAITATESNHTITDYSFSHQNGLTEDISQAPIKINSWYLLEIIPLSGQTITFTYENEESTMYQRNGEVAEKDGNGFVNTSYFSEIKNSQQKIGQIDFGHGKITFNYNTTRDDLKAYDSTKPPKALTSMEVHNNNGKRIKKYVFDYVHTVSNKSTNILHHLNTNAPESKQRLFLNSVKEQGNDDSYLPPYEFTYNPQVLPSRFSTSHDKWGYYNGKNNGLFSVFADNLYQIGGTTIDTDKVQAGLLTKIKYPTGGSAEYVYEANRAEFPDHLRDHVAFAQNNPAVTRYVVLDKDPKFYDFQTKEYSIPFTIDNIVPSQAFTVPPHLIDAGAIKTEVFLDDPDCTGVESYDCPYFVKIFHENGTNIYATLHKTSNFISITPGNYILRVIPTDKALEDPYDWGDDFGIQLSWQEYVTPEEETLIYTGGNRIKRILLKDGSGNTLEKKYEYTYADGNTSGKVFALPSYYGYGTTTIQGGVQVKIFHHVMFKPANTLTLEQGNHGGYAFVTEYIGDKTNNIGKNEYTFTTMYDGGQYYIPPYHLPNSNERLRGKPLKITNYKNNNGVYERVRETNNVYEYVFDLDPRTYKETDLVVFGFNPNTQSPISHSNYKVFYLSAGVYKLSSSETVDYLENGNVTNHTEYLYDYSKHYQVQKTKTVDSKGKKRITKSTYLPLALVSDECRIE